MMSAKGLVSCERSCFKQMSVIKEKSNRDSLRDRGKKVLLSSNIFFSKFLTTVAFQKAITVYRL